MKSKILSPKDWKKLPENQNLSTHDELMRGYADYCISFKPEPSKYVPQVTSSFSPIFDFFYENHDLILTEGEMQEIIYACTPFVSKSEQREIDWDKLKEEFDATCVLDPRAFQWLKDKITNGGN